MPVNAAATCNIKCYHNQSDHSNICCHRTTVPEFNCSSLALPLPSTELPAPGTRLRSIRAILGPTLYTFTPNAGQCGATTTLNITVTDQITPTFAAIAQICQNSPAPLLPLTSTNGITGTWNPATINTSTTGTSNYTFTPNAGQCGTTALLSVTITNQITPTFATIGPLCQNSPAPALPLTSTNGITGTWNPATINTGTVGTTNYTFTPDAGQCGTTTAMSITIATQITPAFDDIGPLCQNSTPPALPLVSTNGISGTWNPAAISTSTIGLTQYTFTPAAGQCGTTATLSIDVTDQITPDFDAVGPLCLNSTPPQLPNVSNNGITGSWSPTISTGTVGTTIYTFTPDAGQCGAATTLSITVTDQITPTFNAIGPFCLNSIAPALPLTSTNGIIGTWNPATINTTAVGTTLYTFTPNAGQCGIGFALNITIATQITPTFAQIGPLCQNSVAPSLPVSSIEGVTGTWSPAYYKHNSGRNYHIYIYTGGWTMRIACNHGYCNRWAELNLSNSNQFALYKC